MGNSIISYNIIVNIFYFFSKKETQKIAFLLFQDILLERGVFHNLIRMDMGWAWYYTSGTTKYYNSNIYQNLSSIYYNSTLGYSHKPFALSRVYLN